MSEEVFFDAWLDDQGRVVVRYEDGTYGNQQTRGQRGAAWALASIEGQDWSRKNLYSCRYFEGDMSTTVWEDHGPSGAHAGVPDVQG